MRFRSFLPHYRNHQSRLERAKTYLRATQSGQQIRTSIFDSQTQTQPTGKKITRARARKIQRSTERESALMAAAR